MTDPHRDPWPDETALADQIGAVLRDRRCDCPVIVGTVGAVPPGGEPAVNVPFSRVDHIAGCPEVDPADAELIELAYDPTEDHSADDSEGEE